MSKNLLVKNVASLSIVQIANYVLPLLSIPIITRIIGPDKFGVINYAATFVSYFSIFISYGFDLTATRRLAKDPDNEFRRNTIFNEVFQAKIILFAISSILFYICLELIPPLRQERTVAIYSFLYCIGTILTQDWMFIAMQDLSKVALFNFISKLLFTVLILNTVHQKSDYQWQPLVTSLVQILVAMISFTWAFKRYNLKFISVNIKEIVNLLKKEVTIFLSIILIGLYTTTNLIILGLFQTYEKVGFYAGGQKLIIVAYSVINLPLSQALFPYIGKAFAQNFEEGLSTTQKIIPIIIFLTGSMGIAMLILGPWLLRIFYGNSFEPSVIIFELLVFTPLLISLSSVFGTQIMLNLNMDKLFMKITLTATVISILSNLILVNKFGYIGSALNWLFTEAMITVSMYIALRMKGINPINYSYFNLKPLRDYLKPVINRVMPLHS